jgi:hypothetical protein
MMNTLRSELVESRKVRSKLKLVFLCWSGTRSRNVAAALDEALREVGGLEPVRSPEIAKGSIWFEQVRQTLEAADAAIVCLTPENVGNAWMHFEAGAIAAKMSSKSPAQATARVYPYLFQMNGVELTGPLAQFQATTATEEDTVRLVRELLPESQWEQWVGSAHSWWTKLEQGLHRAEDRPLQEILPDLEALFRRKTFNEPLHECVNQAWAARWSGARDTHRRLQEKVNEVSHHCRPYARNLLAHLVEAVDSYAMALELLLVPRSFDLKENGTRNIPPGLLAACEQRRKHIKEVVSGLADPRGAPVFDDAPRFQTVESFSEKKALVHQFEAWLERSQHGNSENWRLEHAKTTSLDAARTSRWDFDRVAFYLCNEATPPEIERALDWVRVELEKARADDEASHMPLTYCLVPLDKAIQAAGRGCPADVVEKTRALLEDICAIAKAREQQRAYPEPSRLRIEANKVLARLGPGAELAHQQLPTANPTAL